MKNINWQKLILELFVVFLGVTGGFILNNFRDTQKDKQLEIKYIESFIQNTNSNIEELTSIIKDDSIWFKKMSIKLHLMVVDSLPQDSTSTIIKSILMASNLGLVTSTFEDIKYSGNLNLIRDYKLKEEIVKYHNQIEGSMFIDKYYNEYFSNFVMPFIIDKYDLAKNKFFSFDNQTKGKLFNTTAGYYSMRQQRTGNLKKLLLQSEQLKIKLEDSLQ